MAAVEIRLDVNIQKRLKHGVLLCIVQHMTDGGFLVQLNMSEVLEVIVDLVTSQDDQRCNSAGKDSVG